MFDQVCGVLSLLGYDEPVAALRNVQTSIARFADATVAPEPDDFGRIAQNLGAIGFFVESVGQDADRPRGMFRYDPATGIFSADLGSCRGPNRHRAGRRRATSRRGPSTSVCPTRRGDNVEAAARKTLEAAHAQATRLRPGCRRRACDRRSSNACCRALANEADLLDNDALKQKATRAVQLLSRS